MYFVALILLATGFYFHPLWAVLAGCLVYIYVAKKRSRRTVTAEENVTSPGKSGCVEPHDMEAYRVSDLKSRP